MKMSDIRNTREHPERENAYVNHAFKKMKELVGLADASFSVGGHYDAAVQHYMKEIAILANSIAARAATRGVVTAAGDAEVRSRADAQDILRRHMK